MYQVNFKGINDESTTMLREIEGNINPMKVLLSELKQKHFGNDYIAGDLTVTIGYVGIVESVWVEGRLSELECPKRHFKMVFQKGKSRMFTKVVIASEEGASKCFNRLTANGFRICDLFVLD